MAKLANWIGLLVLALLTQSCLATGYLHEWANERAPRSEVIGVVDGGARLDALIFRMHGERGYADGLYEAPIERIGDPRSDLDAPVLKPLGKVEIAVIESMPKGQSRIACLEDSKGTPDDNRLPTAGFERVDGTLRRIDASEKLYYVSVCGEVGSREGKSFTKVAVHSGHGANGDLHSQGCAYLPPSRSENWRVAIGVLATPVTFAFDIVTAPAQVAFLIVFLAAADFKFGFPDVDWNVSPELRVLGDMVGTTWFVMSCIPMVVDPAIGGMLLQWPKAQRPVKI